MAEENEKLSEDDVPLTEEEVQAYQQKLDIALKKSNELIKDFKVYIGVYRSNLKAQVSHLTKEEYDVFDDPIKNHSIKSVSRFYSNLSEEENYVTKNSIVLTKDNFAMAFHPMIWKILTFEERITAMRIAWQQFNDKDVNEFCNHVTTTVAFVGKDYKGALNIGALLVYGGDDGALNILHQIADAANELKFNYYFNKRKEKNYNYITDFKSFEEMQYVSPLDTALDNLNLKDPVVKAMFLNQLSDRRRRDNFLNADYLVLEHSDELSGLNPRFDKILQKEIENIKSDINFVIDQLGYSQKSANERYLEIKIDTFNNFTKIEHNKLVRKYQKLDSQIKELKKIVVSATKDLHDKRDAYKEELKNASNAIEMYELKEEIDRLTKKIIKIQKKDFKKELKYINELSKKREAVYDEIQEVDSHIITLEDAKNHFKDYFYPEDNVAANKSSKISKTKSSELPDDKKMELN